MYTIIASNERVRVRVRVRCGERKFKHALEMLFGYLVMIQVMASLSNPEKEWLGIMHQGKIRNFQ
jgi:hypothetical protein